MDKSDATGISGVIVGAGFAVAGIAFPWEMSPLVRHVLFWSGSFVAVAGIMWLLHLHFFRQRSASLRYGVQCLIVFISVLLLCIVEWPGGDRVNLQQEHSINSITIDPETPVLAAFNNNFKNYLRLSTTIDFHDTASDRHAEGLQQLMIHFESNSEFMAFYIPQTPMIYSIAMNIADNFDKMLKHMRSIVFTRQKEGDFAKFKSENLRFSGVVYLYTEDALDDRGMDAIRNKFKPLGITVQFRNPFNIKNSID